MEWSGGSDTMDRALSRIHQREEAALKRERAMAYAFTHQVCNSNVDLELYSRRVTLNILHLGAFAASQGELKKK